MEEVAEVRVAGEEEGDRCCKLMRRVDSGLTWYAYEDSETVEEAGDDMFASGRVEEDGPNCGESPSD